MSECASPRADAGGERLDGLDPVHAFACFADDPGTIFFDSAAPSDPRARWSFLCPWPRGTLRAEAGGAVLLDGKRLTSDPLDALRARIARVPCIRQPGVPFTGGAAGFLSYEFGARLLPVPRAPGQQRIPDLFAGFYDTVLAFDRQTGQAWLFAPDQARRDRVLHRLAQPPRGTAAPPLDWQFRTGRQAHLDRIRRALGYIAAGDIYQANIALRAEAALPAGAAPAALFLALRRHCPAPFSAYLGLGGGQAILSASPERFLRVDPEGWPHGWVETRPIKGTRPRAPHPPQDAELARALLASEKDRAENLMIVDLMRNDLSRVADEVSVREFCALESYAHVHHLVSSVRGRLRPGRDAVALLRATFPGGSITGAPKIRAMQIIAELEQEARGAYCGTAFWIGPDGAMDSSILIRTLTVDSGRVTAQAGGGIVADSDPDEEWREAMVKLLPLLQALGDAGPPLV